MKRSEILAQYDVDSHGIIHSPGKFEGEYLYAPYFSDADMEGCSEILASMEDAGEYAALIEVQPEDRTEFPELEPDTAFILLCESDQGFVSVRELTAKQADKVRADYEREAELRDAESEDGE